MIIGDLDLNPAFSTSVRADEAARLGELARGRRVLEIGSGYGYTATVMALAGAHVTAVDPHMVLPSFDLMAANLAAYKVADRVTMVRDASPWAVTRLGESGARFGLAFVDGDHQPSSVAADVRAALTVLEPGGILAVHDYGEDCCGPLTQVIDDMFPGGPDDVTVTLWQKRITG